MTANHEQLLRPSGIKTDAPLQSSRLAYENRKTRYWFIRYRKRR